MAQLPPISFRASASERQSIASLASELGYTRHRLIRVALRQFIESQKTNQAAGNNLVNQDICDHYRQAVINN